MPDDMPVGPTYVLSCTTGNTYEGDVSESPELLAQAKQEDELAQLEVLNAALAERAGRVNDGSGDAPGLVKKEEAEES